MNHFKNAKEFLNQSELYKLGELPTESTHPKTVGLSEWAENDLQKAIATLKDIDLEALEKMQQKLPEIQALHLKINEVINSGGRIFLCGCGATGRLSINLEVLWRNVAPRVAHDRVVSFMAGGDTALVHSLEGFEDFDEYGERQLLELGFQSKDLLIAITEGGETPFVIGAVQSAVKVSNYNPYFVYCNPNEVLCRKVKRAREVINNKKINKLNLSVGPMALSGSTRMQASTVQMFSVGLALLSDSEEQLVQSYQQLISYYQKMDLSCLQSYIEAESEVYKSGSRVTYKASDHTSIVVFTDTTERAPTFSLPSFEPGGFESLSYVSIEGCKTKEQVWDHLLHRQPRVLNWESIDTQTTDKYLQAFDFSEQALKWRVNNRIFRVSDDGENLSWEFDQLKQQWNISGLELLNFHLVLKMMMNIHSTLVMGRMHRYESNIMTWVRPSNGKLIDRAARYCMQLIRQKGMPVSYAQVVHWIFELKKTLKNDQSIVKLVVDKIVNQDVNKSA